MQVSPKYTPAETARRAEEWYNTGLRQQLETDENLGKIVAIDIDTGAYALADDVLTAAEAMQQHNQNADLYLFRIGYPSVYKVGGRQRPSERFRK